MDAENLLLTRLEHNKTRGKKKQFQTTEKK